MSYETSKALATERQNDLRRSAAIARLARRVRRTRHQAGHVPDTDIGPFIVRPATSATTSPHMTTDQVLVA